MLQNRSCRWHLPHHGSSLSLAQSLRKCDCSVFRSQNIVPCIDSKLTYNADFHSARSGRLSSAARTICVQYVVTPHPLTFFDNLRMTGEGKIAPYFFYNVIKNHPHVVINFTNGCVFL